MHGVPRPIRDDAADNLLSQERQIANQVENFVAHKFIVKAQRAVLYAVGGQNNHVIFRCATDQPHIFHGALFAEETKSPRRSQFFVIEVA